MWFFSRSSTPPTLQEPVLLNIFNVDTENLTNPNTSGVTQSSTSSTSFSSILKSITAAAASLTTSVGLGVHHTSVTTHGFTYQFDAINGITKFPSHSEYQMQGFKFEKSKTVASTEFISKAKLSSIIAALREFFLPGAYHLTNRNCNHFTYALVASILIVDEHPFADETKMFQSVDDIYPHYVNRLANTVSSNILQREVLAVVSKVTNSTFNTINNNTKQTKQTQTKTQTKTNSSKKKELTEKQITMIEKLKKKG